MSALISRCQFLVGDTLNPNFASQSLICMEENRVTNRKVSEQIVLWRDVHGRTH